MPTLSFCPPMPILSSLPVLTFLFGSPVPASSSLSIPVLSSFFMPTLLFLFLPVLLSSFMPALSSCFILDPTLTWLTSSTLRTFKQTLSNEPLSRQSTSPSSPKSLYLFPILSPLPKKSNCKRLFDMTFINSCPLATNYAAKEIDPNFREYGCFAPVKLNRL